MDAKEVLLASVKKNLNVPGVINDVLDLILEPALKKIVEDTGNPFDDILFASVYPLLEKELKAQAAILFEKLLAAGAAAPAEGDLVSAPEVLGEPV